MNHFAVYQKVTQHCKSATLQFKKKSTEKINKLLNEVFSNHLSSIQFSSVTQSCLTLCDPMNHSMPGPPVRHQLPESTQKHVH